MDENLMVFEGKKVLLIDDDLTQLKLLEGLLKKMGFSVTSFQSPVQALMSIDSAYPPDLVITDIYMPELNGWEVCRHLRSEVSPFIKDIPILIISSIFVGEGILKTAREAGADGFIEMPIDPEKLFATIQSVFSGKKRVHVTPILWVAPCSKCSYACCPDDKVPGYEIEHVEHIKQAIKILDEKKYDLAVISYKTYEDPVPFIKKLKEKNENAVIIAILSEKSEKEFIYWMEKGVSALIKEPVSVEHIISLYEKIKLEKAFIQTKDLLEQKIRETLTEELKWATVLDALPIGVFIKNEKLEYIRVNKAFAGLFDKNPGEVIHFTDDMLFEGTSAKEFSTVCERALKGEVYNNLDWVLSIHGKEKIFCAYIAPLKNAEGEITGVFGTFHDMTEFRKLQQNYKHLFESMQEAFAEHEFIYDEQGIPVDYRFLVANKAFEKMTGLKVDEIIGKRVKEVLPDLEPQWIFTYAQVVATGHSVTFEMYTKTLDRYYVVHAFKTGTNRFACTFTDISEKKRIEEEIKRLNHEWQIAFDNVNSVIWVLNTDFEITRTNNAVLKLLELTPDEVLGKKCWEVVHETKEPPSFCPVLRLLKTKISETLEFSKDDRWYEVVVDPVFGENKELTGFVHFLSDITERKKAEEERIRLQKQLIQSQKLDAVGRLASGIAHDFNNMLSVIMGNVELAILKTETGEPVNENLEEVRKAVERASELTKKILAFAGNQETQPRVLNLNDEITGYIKMLRRVIPERIEIEYKPSKEIWDVYIDPTHLDMILLNLCVNARDAIVSEGKITIEVLNKEIDENFVKKHPNAYPGEFVVLRVSDTGMGIPPENMDKIFDPFFTTKKPGEGTGLGLSTVYGTVKSNNGFITVESELGKGSVFTVYFPRYKRVKEEGEKSNGNNKKMIDNDFSKIGDKGTVLVIDDEKGVLEILNQIISRLGFEPLITDDPMKALQIARENRSKIKLLITDIVLPKMSGFELASEMEKIIPSLPTLFITGYADEHKFDMKPTEKEIHLIRKPFTIQSLTQKIQNILQGKNI